MTDEAPERWRARAAAVIPGASSTGSRRPEALYGGLANDPLVPTHFVRAAGCELWDTDGRRFIDCGMALGAVGLGYADPEVTRAVVQAATEGNVSTLPHRLEVEAAEQLVQLIPCAERVRFLRTGAEASAAAIRIARTLTGRTRVIASGYFGWLDWCSDAAGVPDAVRADTSWVPFNDVAALETAIADGPAPAAIIIEPLVHDIADVAWLSAARRLADANGAILIFDEVKTAFRVRTGGVQALTGIIPDLATLGKAMANGYPVSAVVGRTEVMEAVRRTWISSTAATESTGLAAVCAVLARHQHEEVCAGMAGAGGRLKTIVQRALDTIPTLGVRTEGPAAMWRLVAEHEVALDRLVAAAAHAGVLLKRGAYQFGALAHDDAACADVERGLALAVDLLQLGAMFPPPKQKHD